MYVSIDNVIITVIIIITCVYEKEENTHVLTHATHLKKVSRSPSFNSLKRVWYWPSCFLFLSEPRIQNACFLGILLSALILRRILLLRYSKSRSLRLRVTMMFISRRILSPIRKSKSEMTKAKTFSWKTPHFPKSMTPTRAMETLHRTRCNALRTIITPRTIIALSYENQALVIVVRLCLIVYNKCVSTSRFTCIIKILFHFLSNNLPIIF